MTEIYIYDKKNITLSYYKFNQNDVYLTYFKNRTWLSGILSPRYVMVKNHEVKTINLLIKSIKKLSSIFAHMVAKIITLSYYKFNQNDVSVACFKNITHQRGTIIPLTYYALGNSGGEGIFMLKMASKLRVIENDK